MIFKEFKISIFKEDGGPKNTKDTVYGFSGAYIGVSQCFTYRSNEKTERKWNFGVMSPPLV
jgi:hypothetical protein